MTKQEKMFGVVEGWPTSGLSKERYAAELGLSTSTLHYWFKNYRERGGNHRHSAPAPASSFIEIPVVRDQNPEALQGRSVITLASGTRIEVS